MIKTANSQTWTHQVAMVQPRELTWIDHYKETEELDKKITKNNENRMLEKEIPKNHNRYQNRKKDIWSTKTEKTI